MSEAAIKSSPIKDESPVSKLTQELFRELELLHQIITSVEGRLEPVLYDGPKPAGEDGEASQGATSPLGAQIVGQTANVRSARYRIASILDRLDI